MKITCIASSSKGNAFLVQRKHDAILIDAGAKVTDHFDKILITHAHIDHISHLKSLSKQTKWFAPYQIAKDIEKRTQVEIMREYEPLNDISIRAFIVNHDVQCAGYVIFDGDESYCHITDTIMFEPPDIAKNCTYYGIESNYERAMIFYTDRPFHTIKRIIEKGHLSNHDAVEMLEKLAGNNTKGVMWLHMSEGTNDPIIANMTHKDLMKKEIEMAYAKKGVSIGQ